MRDIGVICTLQQLQTGSTQQYIKSEERMFLQAQQFSPCSHKELLQQTLHNAMPITICGLETIF